MQLAGRYQDGVTADVVAAICSLEGTGGAGSFVISDMASRREVARWPASLLYAMHARRDELRIGASNQPAGARLVITGAEAVAMARAALPALAQHQRLDRGRQFRIAGLATGALLSVIVAYLVGVPLLAAQIVPLVPAPWEEQMGDTVARQIEATLGGEAGFEVCDSDPDSRANKALARFARQAMQDSGSPFDARITVVRSDVLNAFALPGGRVYYFSALLDRTQSPDEFAGVLSHEIGHVVYRHSMEQLIAGAGTGLLVGFVLGDLTGLSVAAALGSTLIESRFSRDAELQADFYAAGVARRQAFNPAGLPDLLERIAEDDDATRALALLSTHPLTAERRAALERLEVDRSGLEPAFTRAEWRAIKAMCGNPKAASRDSVAPAPAPDPDLPDRGGPGKSRRGGARPG